MDLEKSELDEIFRIPLEFLNYSRLEKADKISSDFRLSPALK